MYPAEYELDLVLRSGDVARFRPITPEDGADLVDFFDRLGQMSRYYRFFRVKERLSDEEVEHFTTVDYDRRMAFVVYLDEQLVGVGRYDVVDDGPPATAEVAFAVADEHQGKGIGTLLLELLTTYARTHGIGRFTAFVLPDNMKMMRVFRNSGYEMKRTVDEGVYTVEFPVALSADARKVAERREQQAVSASILPLFYPSSVAVIGASTNPKSIGGRLLTNLIDTGFVGQLYPVHPRADEVAGLRAYSSVLEIPGPVDLAVIVVPAAAVNEVARQCALKGVRGLVVISAGFSEVGDDGRARERELLDIVRGGGMRMVGPNCMGLLNTDPAVNLNATFAPTYPLPGNIAMSSQSGALGIAILDYTRRHGIGISNFVSVGNKADVSGNDLLLLWEGDPRTDVIVLYLESFGNPRRFARIARRISRQKPIVAVKSGRTSAGSRAASSHTGALASADIAVDALFRHAGVIRTDTLEELFDVSALLASQPLPAGRRVAIVTNAGGPAILAADALEAEGLELPAFSDELRDRLRQGLPAEAAVGNPVDLIASAGPAEYSHALSAVCESDEVDAVVGIYIPASPDGADELAAAVMDVAQRFHGTKTLLSVIMHPDPGADRLASDDVTIPVYEFPEAAARALAHAADHAEWIARPEGEFARLDDPDAVRAVAQRVVARLERDDLESDWLRPAEVFDLLAAAGVRLPATEVVVSADEAAAAARRIGGPVAVKVDAPTALHKSDIGGVILGVEGDEAVRAAFAQVTAAAADWTGVVVQEMVEAEHEVLVGMTEDPNFGPLLVFGLGGVFVELLGDVAFRINPITDLDADEMIAEIKAGRLLSGYRGIPPADVEAAKRLLLSVSALIDAVPEIEEMDLNPVKVLAPGEGAVAVDARIRLRVPAEGWSPELADYPSLAGRPLRERGSNPTEIVGGEGAK